MASPCSRSTSARPTPAGSGAAASMCALLRLLSDKNGGSAEQQNCLASRMEVGLMADEGPSVPSKNPAWGSAIAMNGLGEGNAEPPPAAEEDEDGCLGDWAVAAGGSAMRLPPPCLAATAFLDLLRSIARGSGVPESGSSWMDQTPAIMAASTTLPRSQIRSKSEISLLSISSLFFLL
uniref:Uncharacterized protein n=1 Tax=Arundo donax TaxID=35708 RepID=A0A0A9ER40_ARUDO